MRAFPVVAPLIEANCKTNEQEAKQVKRLLCMLLALMLLFTGAVFAAEDLPANTEEEEIVTEEAEFRTAWTPSQAIVEFIANQEGFRSKPHKSGGYWYIGYGTQIKSGQYSGGISREKARAIGVDMEKNISTNENKMLSSLSEEEVDNLKRMLMVIYKNLHFF